MINYFFEEIPSQPIAEATTNWLEFLISNENKKLGPINYIFCDDQYLLKINREYLNHDYYTDIITFDYVKHNLISGDIFVSLPRISENAKYFSKSFESEFRRVLAHGLLHLCGYKDKSERESAEMRAKEDYYLNVYLEKFS